MRLTIRRTIPRLWPACEAALLWLLGLPWLTLGLLIGLAVSLALWIAVSFLAGYRAGRIGSSPHA